MNPTARRWTARRARAAPAAAAAAAAALLAASPVRAAEPAPADAMPGFPVGEELVYRIHWGKIPVGEARATTAWTEWQGRRVLAIRFRTRSNNFLSALYPVDDTIESLVDPDGFRTLQFVKRLNEGSHHYDQTTTFDWTNRTAHWVSKLDGRERRFPIEDDTRDIPTLMYALRAQGFEPHGTRRFRVMADEKIYDMEAVGLGEEKVRLPKYGRVPCVKVEPKASFQGVFVRKGRMFVWATRDARHLAVRISVEVPVARVWLTLYQVRGPGDDFWVGKEKGGAGGGEGGDDAEVGAENDEPAGEP